MNIALMHFRVGETDGVSLEMDKWKKVLEHLGHKVFYIAGSSGSCEAFIIPELHYRGEYDLLLNEEAYAKIDKFNEQELEDAVLKVSRSIEKQLLTFIKENNINVLVPNNILSLGRSPHTAIAVTNVLNKTGIKAVAHNHDFYWEREFFSKPTTNFIKEQLEIYFPPTGMENQIKQVVINTLAKEDLLVKKGLLSTVVPNVFDFKDTLWKTDDYNKSFKKDLGINDNQILMLQATRVTDRKAIELAIDLISVMNEPENRRQMIGKTLYDGRIFDDNTEYVLVLVGIHEGSKGYSDKLVAHAKKKGVNMLVNTDLVDHSRGITKEGKKVYSLWDAYVDCDMITYPSIYEGWGNQFLEGLFAKKPQIVFEYSVYERDIKSMNFKVVSLGNKYISKENGLVEISHDIIVMAAQETMEILTNHDKYYVMVEENFEIGTKHLSLEALEVLLKELF